eukprot:52202-Eustigmatos_ZCMA.PRE.1
MLLQSTNRARAQHQMSNSASARTGLTCTPENVPTGTAEVFTFISIDNPHNATPPNTQIP